MSSRLVGNLPAELTSFVGRRKDLAHAKNLLASSRLLTVTGIGGIGKTRLARRLASEVRRTFPDGAWLVELADLRQSSLLAQTIGAALGIRDEFNDPVGALIDHLREQRLLLILDNCEHLTDSCPLLIGALLKAAPSLKIVATSRHVLGVEGEQVFPLTSLAHESEQGPNEAMELFEERASAADPVFRIADDNREAVDEICRRLEGLPLAVELAAANVRAFSPAEILERLQRTELLTAGERTRPSRHRTLRAAVEWSYGLCTPLERRTWEQLSVFSGGFTVAAAEAVCTATDGDASVLGALLSLVDKSIVERIDGRAGGKVRYRMLEPVRQYAAERLAAAPDAHDVRRRHRDYFLRLAHRSHAEYCSDRDVEWYASIREEHANIRVALEFCLSDAQEPRVGVEMATALRPFWEQSGSILEGYRWLLRGLAQVPEPSYHRTAGLVAASILGFLLDDSENASTLLEEYRAVFPRFECHEFIVLDAFAAALEFFAHGDMPAAFAQTMKAVDLGLGRVNPGIVAEAMALSALYAFVIEHEQAENIAHRFVTYTESHGAHLLKAVALYTFGAVRWHHGDVESATAFMREALRLYQMFEHSGLSAACIEGLAWSAADSEPDRAAMLLGAAKNVWSHSQMRLPEIAVQAVGTTIETRLRQKLGDLGFEQAFATGQELSHDRAVALALGSPEPRSKPATSAGRAALTRREQQVAALVAEGLTNKEIAAKLVMSPRTADAHVEHILAKLGFRSRTQIARWFTQVQGG